MNSHGILMSGEMMRAYLAGRKNQTRRARGLALINEHPDYWCFDGVNQYGEYTFTNTFQPAFPQQRIKPAYGYIGDELWFKETHAVYMEGDVVCYRATDPRPKDVKWTPSIFMKRIHTRVVTRGIEVRVERVRDISEMDTMNEGLWNGYSSTGPEDYHRKEFFRLLDSLNQKTLPAQNNHWVWVYEFPFYSGEEVVSRG